MIDEYETKCGCGDEYILLIEYAWNEPEHYDGISEITCTKCKRRWGRWTGNELKDGDVEPRYGTGNKKA